MTILDKIKKIYSKHAGEYPEQFDDGEATFDEIWDLLSDSKVQFDVNIARFKDCSGFEEWHNVFSWIENGKLYTFDYLETHL